ncbi:MAG: TonB-dependent receptor plug domain-containing protein, partial [Candidatus Latescibacteria bacterium]|nr:TonB-dependent receptor plug domain-containing protein [Candidatus Latescibacterota bacterium]
MLNRFILVVFLCLDLPSLSFSQETRPRDSAVDFSKLTSTVLAPVYGPLAGQIISDYDLENKKGTGIDIGGGPGNLVIELCKRTQSMHWINSDIKTDNFPFTAKMAGEAGLGNRISTMFADVHDLPFLDNYADVIVSRGSFQFWEDKRKAFSEIFRVLKPGGAALIGRGFSENLPVDVARKVREGQRAGKGEPKYDVAQTAAELESVMKALGIKNYEIRLPVPPGSEGVNYGVWVEFRKSFPEYVMEPISVKASPERDIREKPLTESSGLELSTTVIERQEMEKQGSKTVIDVLEYVPGAWIETRGRKVKQFFSTRGQKYPYPEYAVDGALFRDFHEIPYFFSSADIERIEVLRSSAAMLSGISGLAGIINIVPRTYKTPQTSWEAEYGTFGTYRSHLSHGATVKDVSYAIGVDSPHTDGPDKRNAAENMANFQSTISWKPTQSLSVRTSIFHINGKRELALAKPPASERFQTEISRFDPFRTTFASLRTLYRPAGKNSTELLLYYANRDHMYINETDTGHKSTHEMDYEWGLNLVQSHAVSANNVLRVGGYYNHWVA